MCLDRGEVRLEFGPREAVFLSLLDMLYKVTPAQAQRFLEDGELYRVVDPNSFQGLKRSKIFELGINRG